MTSVDIDTILNKLSVKFNKIFCDREFVGCVIQDFRVVIENNKKCCVLVFPALSPNYLKAIQYQAKLFDLAVFPLNCGIAKSVAVCHKKYLLQNCVDVKENFKEPEVDNLNMPESALDAGDGAPRKKRPERQLYVPPAQRKSRLSKGDPSLQFKKQILIPQDIQKINKKTEKHLEEYIVQKSLKDLFILRNLHVRCLFWDYKVTKHDHIIYSGNCEVRKDIDLPFQVTLFTRTRRNKFLYILDSLYFCWQPKLNFNRNFSDNNFSCANDSTTYPIYNLEGPKHIDNEKSLVSIYPVEYSILASTAYKTEVENFNAFETSAFKIKCSKSEFSECEHEIIDFSPIGTGHLFVICFLGNYYFFDCFENHDVFECYLSKKRQLKESNEETLNNVDVLVNEMSHSTVPDKIDVPKLSTDNNSRGYSQNDTSHLEKDAENNEQCFKVSNSIAVVSEEIIECRVETKNIKNTIINTNETPKDPVILTKDKSSQVKKPFRKTSEHEEEKEIMRKTKENINRKTRPIIKYVEGDNTLNIDKTDNINNWEELFDNDGELQEDIFTEIIHKVGTDVTIVKAAEDYSAYATKQIEELEHMVELYDFPPTFETHDIIAAFSELNSDSMYVKWVDETHALLVLGSLTQAQRAVEVSSPLIKVRPMSAASSTAIAKANKCDLRPAMKRPQTNLQTARRLITTHLGAKSRISKEQSAKEKEDLRTAREMKKLTKKNEKDAWEGKLRSSSNN